MSLSNLAARAKSRYQRDSARFLFRRLVPIKSSVPIISFTFDDFPRSALLEGGAILSRFGAKGTYYTSFGLSGTVAPTGPIFLAEDIPLLLQAGHELGCHTYTHCDSWETTSSVFEESVERNASALRALVPGADFRTLSYPISPPRPSTKRRAAKHFQCCRGGGQAFSVGTADLNHLPAYFIEQARNQLEVLTDVIDRNQRARGWLIFATHDVAENHTPFGCTPQLFEKVVDYAARSGASILPVTRALEALRR